MGTIDYMAPEQTGDSHDVDIRADIYALGATLFKLLCNQVPYANARLDTAVKKLNALATQPVPSIREIRSDVPKALDHVISKALAKDADERYATPEALARELAPFCEGAQLAEWASQTDQVLDGVDSFADSPEFVIPPNTRLAPGMSYYVKIDAYVVGDKAVSSRHISFTVED